MELSITKGRHQLISDVLWATLIKRRTIDQGRAWTASRRAEGAGTGGTKEAGFLPTSEHQYMLFLPRLTHPSDLCPAGTCSANFPVEALKATQTSPSQYSQLNFTFTWLSL